MRGLAVILLLASVSALAQTVTPTTLPACLLADGSGTVSLALSGMTVCVPPTIGPVTVLVTGSGVAPPPGTDLLVNSSFEAPALAAGAYAYDPAGATWTFAGNAGIEANSAAWYAPASPDGSQAVFLQGNGSLGSITQAFAVATAGTFTLSFYAAQRASVTQPIAVLIDGVLVETVSPASNAFTLSSVPLSLAAGNHTIVLSATDNTADKTTFIDLVTIE